MPLSRASLQEVGGGGGRAGSGRHSRAIRLRQGPTSNPESPRGVTELRGSSLDLKQFPPPAELVLAAADAATHAAWLAELALRCASTVEPPQRRRQVGMKSAMPYTKWWAGKPTL